LQDILHNLLRICSCLKEFLDISEADDEGGGWVVLILFFFRERSDGKKTVRKCDKDVALVEILGERVLLEAAD
jgi:hypothetical protein